MGTYRNNAQRMPSVADTTSFRNWIIDFVAMLEGSGWAQSADTGQLDETTVTYPATVSTVAGYQIWYLNDSLHSTYPLYVKFIFGRGSTSTRVSLTFQFAYATDGAGNLTGWTDTVRSMMTGSASSNQPSVATGVGMGSGGEGYGWFVNGRGCWPTANHVMLHVARQFDDEGEVVSNGNWSYTWQAPENSRLYAASINRTMGLQFYTTDPVCAIPFTTTQSGSATQTELWRHLMKFPEVTPMATVFTYMAGDIQMDAPFQTAVSGKLRTYIPSGIDKAAVGASTSHMAAMVWE
jgi:hypothetical protein